MSDVVSIDFLRDLPGGRLHPCKFSVKRLYLSQCHVTLFIQTGERGGTRGRRGRGLLSMMVRGTFSARLT